MATVAEMRARLAKYKLPSEVSDAETRTVLPDSTQISQVSAAQPTNLPQEEQVRSVVTDVQPTTLVVVERPVAAPPEDTSARIELRSRETQLDSNNPVHLSFLQRLGDLESSLLARDPLMKTHLREIHKTMMEYEEIANLLTTEEISQIMAAQQVHTNTVLRQDTVKASKAKASAKAAQLGLNDI